jgi:hypothetical protein
MCLKDALDYRPDEGSRDLRVAEQSAEIARPSQQINEDLEIASRAQLSSLDAAQQRGSHGTAPTAEDLCPD